jgi:ankyrin repeat protein
MAAAGDDLLKAIDAGDRAAVAGLLDGDPSLANATYTAEQWTLPLLYRACMSGHIPIVRLLLERGARTQDGESIYHSAQDNRRECLELLLQHGADLSERQAQFGNTPLYFLAGHHGDEEGRATWFRGFLWLLEHGADPNVTSDKAEEAPLHRVAASPLKRETARALLAHGADVNLKRGDGLTPYQIAARHGNTDMAALLLEHGADAAALTPLDQFLNASLTGDGARARALLASHPDLVTSMSPEDHAGVIDAVMHGRADVVRLMVELGFRLDAENAHGGTPLHWAAWHGKTDMVDLLIRLGAPINVRDRQYGASPLGWTAHGSECHQDDDSYCAIVDKLVDAGATREFTINKWGEALQGSPRVKARVDERLGGSA